ncbi:MAG: hypothetical protein LC633_05480 [Desulfobulbaceae bacterium]|nr:hypothetical protein [Desulfobulbaceae bacterium]
MQGLYFLVPTLFTILVSFMVVREAGIALMMTGLNANKAKFHIERGDKWLHDPPCPRNHPERRQTHRLRYLRNPG